MPWHFCAVGEGRPPAAWTSLLTTLSRAGYDGVVSVEHEDPRYAAEEGIERSLAALRRAMRDSETQPRAV